MESIKLNELETRVFNELFSLCDSENTGKVYGPKASELFINSGLTTDILHQIIEFCGAKRLGHFGRSQFYVALKMIALAQSGLPLTPESFSLGRDLPLPKFDFKKSALHSRGSLTGQIAPPPLPQSKHIHINQTGRSNQHFEQASSVSNQQQQGLHDPIAASPTNHQQANSRSPPISPRSSNNQQPGFHGGTGTGSSVLTKSHPHHQPQPQTVNNSSGVAVGHVQQPNHPPVHHQVAVGAAGYNSYESQPPPSHRLEKGWASFENDDDYQGLLSDQRKEWAHFTDSSKADTSSVSSETDSMTDDVWHVTEEQREYYVNQFKTMQSDVAGLLSGAVAKEFFEKSRLPISELSRIWQLSDVNKDGALSLEEFCTAMHLVVLRRNEIELPNHLPPSLVPYAPFANPDEPFATDLPKSSTIKRLSSGSPATAQQWTTSFTGTIPESPASSSISSPGQKPTPLSFDFKPIGSSEESDIVHPVPLRMSPDGQGFSVDQYGNQVQSTNTQSQDTGGYNSQDLSPNDQLSPNNSARPPEYIEQLIDIGSKPPPPQQQQQQQQTTHSIHHPAPIQPRARPTPIKAQSVPGPTYIQEPNQPLLFPAPGTTSSSHETTSPAVASAQEQAAPSALLATATNTDVPVPPPRKSHSRSASFDTNQVLEVTEKGKLTSTAPPVVPPRPKEGSISSSENFSTVTSLSSQTKKLTPEHSGSGGLDENDWTRPKVLPKQFSQEKKELLSQIRKQKEKNETLCRLNSELNQELQEVMEQRIALEIQMEHLRPYGGSYLYS